MKKKIPKKATAKRPYKKRSVLPGSGSHDVGIGDNDSGLLVIENAPPPLQRYNNPELVSYLEKVDKTVRAAKDGQAFIIRADYVSSIKNFLKKTFPERRFVVRSISDNDAAMRVYCLDYKNR